MPDLQLGAKASELTPNGTGKRFRRSSPDFTRPGKIVRTDHVNHPGVKQIGRATCRERV